MMTKDLTVMGYRIFLAGASGAIGRRLTPLLQNAGHYVCGSTRSKANADALRLLGADPVVVDVFDAVALSGAVASARPDVVIHQLTDLPKDLNPREMGQRSSAPPVSAAKERGTSSARQLRRVRVG
jgi:nucleoside-diphosphate-sugar epimerase